MCGSDVLCQRELICEFKSVTQRQWGTDGSTVFGSAGIDIVKQTRPFIQGESMPLVRIDVLEGKSPEYRAQVGQIVYQALLDTLNVPKNDRFQVIVEHPTGGLQFDRDYLGVHRTDDCIFLQITLNSGRTVEMKQRFYKAVAEGLHQSLKLRREDVVINLVEVPKENWSFGNGEAQYVTPQS
jgi:phenylpyruvate tautomerase PptA (4-oxalocrotonate tautomerase family)